MNKNLLLSACCLIAAVATGAAARTFTPEEEAFMNRRRAVKRERITIGTNEYWIVTYMKGAKPDGVKTNLAHKIEGVPQTNPTEEDASVIRDLAKTARKAKHKDEQTWKNMIKDIEKARDKFIQPEFIDLANKLLAILDQVPEE